MIIGAGIDAIEVRRVAAFVERFQERGLKRLFTAGERDYCRGKAFASQSLAARFAAKEAFLKALGTGLGAGMRWTEIEVVRLRDGAPALRLHGRAADLARASGVRRLHLSISHLESLAFAQVILEGGVEE